MDIVFHLRPSKSNNGVFQAWVNGQQVADVSNTRLGHDDPKGMAPYIGNYQGIDVDDPQEGVLYWDELKISDGNCGTESECIAAVSPGGGNPPPTNDCANDLGGTCCASGQSCSGGSFQSSDDCSTLCCVGGTCQGPPTYECNDGTDNDGDGNTDLADSGCSSGTDSDETDCGDTTCEGGETCGPSNTFPECNVDCGPCQQGTSLLNSSTVTSHSNNFDPIGLPENLWDGCTDPVTGCLTGAGDISSFWLEFDLGRSHDIASTRIFGDDEDNWLCMNWSLYHKQTLQDSWTPSFEGINCLVSDWVAQDLAGTSARYIRVEVFGNPAIPATQARELELFGTPSHGFVLEAQNSEDTLLESAYPDYNYGGASTFYIGSRFENESTRFLLRFPDIISLAAIPQGSAIHSADLILTHTGTQNLQGQSDIIARRVMEPWTEGDNSPSAQASAGQTTWDYTSYNTGFWLSDAGSDGGADAGCSSPQSSTTSGESSNTYTTSPGDGDQSMFNVTGIVQHWADNGEAENHGFLLIAPNNEGTSANYIRFASSENSNPGYVPRIFVRYSPPSSYHPADTEMDCDVDQPELVNFIGLWYMDSTANSINDVITAMSAYNDGTSSCQ